MLQYGLEKCVQKRCDLEIRLGGATLRSATRKCNVRRNKTGDPGTVVVSVGGAGLDGDVRQGRVSVDEGLGETVVKGLLLYYHRTLTLMKFHTESFKHIEPER